MYFRMLFPILPSILHLLKNNVSMFDSEVNMTFTHNCSQGSHK